MAVNISPLEIEVLMRLQYEFPLTPTPFLDVAESLDVGFNELAFMLDSLAKRGILKRVGFYYNYRAQGLAAALLAFSCDTNLGALVDALRKDPLTTHVFLRDHPVYNVWAVVKRSTKGDLLRYAEELASVGSAKGWVALFSKRTFKLSVKFDLLEGVSRAGPYSRVVEAPPRPEDVGIDPTVPRSVRVLTVSERPYSALASKLGVSEEEVLSMVKEMLDKGILSDPGAALEGRSVGFSENVIAAAQPANDAHELCECISRVPYITHVVLREPYPPESWDFTCFFVVHATSREKILRVIEEARRLCKPEGLIFTFSIVDLKPGVVR